MEEAVKILREFEENRYAPVYFLQGEEPYYIDLISNYIEKNALEESSKGFNQVIVYGKDVKLAEVLNHARRFPMMSDRQVVIVKEAQNMEKELGKADNQKMLEAYLKNPQPSTILVFCYKYKSLDRRKKFFKVLDKHAVVLTTKKLYESQIPGWIKKYFSDKGFTVTEKAVYMLADYIGNDLERLANEIDKMLINFKEPGGEIDDRLIQKYIGISKEYNPFELQKAIAYKDPLHVYRIIDYFAANPRDNPVIPIIGTLYSLFSRLLTLHHAKAYTQDAVAGTLNINRFFAKEYIAGLKNYPLPKVIRNIHYLRQADLYSKGVNNASLTEGQILKELAYKLLNA